MDNQKANLDKKQSQRREITDGLLPENEKKSNSFRERMKQNVKDWASKSVTSVRNVTSYDQKMDQDIPKNSTTTEAPSQYISTNQFNDSNSVFPNDIWERFDNINIASEFGSLSNNDTQARSSVYQGILSEAPLQSINKDRAEEEPNQSGSVRKSRSISPRPPPSKQPILKSRRERSGSRPRANNDVESKIANLSNTKQNNVDCSNESSNPSRLVSDSIAGQNLDSVSDGTELTRGTADIDHVDEYGQPIRLVAEQKSHLISPKFPPAKQPVIRRSRNSEKPKLIPASHPATEEARGLIPIVPILKSEEVDTPQQGFPISQSSSRQNSPNNTIQTQQHETNTQTDTSVQFKRSDCVNRKLQDAETRFKTPSNDINAKAGLSTSTPTSSMEAALAQNRKYDSLNANANANAKEGIETPLGGENPNIASTKYHATPMFSVPPSVESGAYAPFQDQFLPPSQEIPRNQAARLVLESSPMKHASVPLLSEPVVQNRPAHSTQSATQSKQNPVNGSAIKSPKVATGATKFAIGANKSAEGESKTATKSNAGAKGPVKAIFSENFTVGVMRDGIFAILFVMHLAIVVYLAIAYGETISVFENPDEGNNFLISFSGTLKISGICIAFAISLVANFMAVIQRFTSFIALLCLGANILAGLGLITLGVMTNSNPALIIGCAMIVYVGFFAIKFFERIPFAISSMKVSFVLLMSHGLVLFVFALMLLLVLALWTALWSYMAIGIASYAMYCQEGVCSSSLPVFLAVLLALSYWWTLCVVKNILSVTVGGVAGTWIATPEYTKESHIGVFKDTVKRAVTKSFGSACIGGLTVCFLLTITRFIRFVQCKGSRLLVCCSDYLTDIIHGAIANFHDWTYTYIGLYDLTFIEAGRNVRDLFRHVGWTSMLADNIVGGICIMMSLSVGVLSAVAAMLVVMTNQNWFPDMALEDCASFAVGLGFLIGFSMAHVLFSVIASASNAVVICFAEIPNDFLDNHPEEFEEMNSSWGKIKNDGFEDFCQGIRDALV